MHDRATCAAAALVVGSACLVLAACSSEADDEPGAAGGSGAVECVSDGAAPNEVVPGSSDPAAGVFTLEEALEDLPMGPGPLRAVITTDLGVLTCEMHSDEAPNGVANFVGLARGRRPWRDLAAGQWVKRVFYDGLIFHRVIPGFVAQGGDPLGTGVGDAGYRFDDEISDLTHQPGTLAYANSGPNTNGSQFYVAETALPSLDGGYTIFGTCTEVSTVEAITSVAVDEEDKPLADVHIQTVEITRCAMAEQ